MKKNEHEWRAGMCNVRDDDFIFLERTNSGLQFAPKQPEWMIERGKDETKIPTTMVGLTKFNDASPRNSIVVCAHWFKVIVTLVASTNAAGTPTAP